MNTQSATWLKRKKQKNKIKACLIVGLGIIGIVLGFYWQSLLLLLLFYIAHELLWSDHIFYNPKSDYLYSFPKAICTKAKLENGRLCLVKGDGLATCDTAVLAISIKSDVFLGTIFDPYVEISDGKHIAKQYFERGLKGKRYINISGWLEKLIDGEVVSIKFKYCQPLPSDIVVYGFCHEDFINKKTLIIAPHADDAELAAFGLYSQVKDVAVVTLTAGEVEAESFSHVYADGKKASLLKGRLRAFDSIAVPQWGGVKPENIIHLGYFCLRLKEMFDDLSKTTISLTAGVDSTKVFREFNSFSLPSDKNNHASGENLIRDLKFLIEKFKPEVIIMPHSQLDPHEDHIYASKFVELAIKESSFKGVEYMLGYANHFHYTDMHPFGPPHSIASLPPNIESVQAIYGLFSLSLSENVQKNKVYALEMMHDLKRPVKLKKVIRSLIQKIIGRSYGRYGYDAYFSKNIKNNEFFYFKK
ncbi:PIG-L deacetylase family protein [Zooshikella harenae]|uniref:PIG-L family deacetylase n=1 Tax=Zooshikella harenae TaxID=2827238 RepID=A0ABS5Z9G5_9GAMM|nr:PIG-L family deacetylase [Zooshikella harenae]MBU2710694.1 PIG-L family deacetylase [Zooshikella harenae]